VASVLSGKSGLGRIESFETRGFPVQIAAEVKGFRSRRRDR